MAYTTRNASAEARAANGLKGVDGRRLSQKPSRRSLGADFETFASTLRRALVPASPLEAILADRLILAAWRLQLASSVEFDTALAGDELPPLSRETLDAERRLEKSLELLETSRADRLGRHYCPAAVDRHDDLYDAGAFSEAEFSNEWTTLPDDAADASDDDGSDDLDLEDLDETEISPRWEDRLVFDFNVSETSPVVKGTWVTVGHVVSLIVDGWTWSDVLRTHPELTEDDIRTCLAYTVEQDSGGC